MSRKNFYLLFGLSFFLAFLFFLPISHQALAQNWACGVINQDTSLNDLPARFADPGDYCVKKTLDYGNTCTGSKCPTGYDYKVNLDCPEGTALKKAMSYACFGYYEKDGQYCRSENSNCYDSLDDVPACNNYNECYKCEPIAICECPAGYSETPSCPPGQHLELLQPAPSCDPNKKCYRCVPVPTFKYCNHTTFKVETFRLDNITTAAQCSSAVGSTCYPETTPDATVAAADQFCQNETCPTGTETVVCLGGSKEACQATFAVGKQFTDGKTILESTIITSEGKFKACIKTITAATFNCSTPDKVCVAAEPGTTGQYANLTDCQTACKANLFVCNCNNGVFSVKPAADLYNNMGVTAGKAAIKAGAYALTGQGGKPANNAYLGFASENQAEVAAMCQAPNGVVPAWCKGAVCPMPPPAGVSAWEATVVSNVAAATQRCAAVGKVLAASAPQTGTPVGTTPKICYACKAATCTCADYASEGLFPTRAAACPAGQPGCIAYQVQKQCATGNKIVCWGKRTSNQCEPQQCVDTRIFGHVVSDPKNVSRLTQAPNGKQYCFANASGLGGDFTNPTVNGDATLGTTGNAEATFEVSLNPPASRPSTVNPTPVGYISAVGQYRFNYLPWNTDTYDITLKINNQNQSGELAAGQKGVWICSCPTSGDDPFTCSYPSVPVPSPANNCPGVNGTNTNPYGAFTKGNDNGSLETITNLACENPAPNFFVTVFDVSHGPWWQASGGTVYAQTRLVSHIPTQSDISSSNSGNSVDYNRCTKDHCAPYLVLKTCNGETTPSGNEKSAGYPLINEELGSDTIVLNDRGENSSAAGDNDEAKTARDSGDTAAGSIFYGPKEDYSYFLGLIPSGMRQGVDSPDNVTSLGSFANCRETVGSGNTSARVCYTGGDLTIANNANISVPSGQSYTVFVEGDLNVGTGSDYGMTYNDNSLSIKVAVGGYLSFIVSGDINIAPQVGYINQNMSYDNGGQTLNRGSASDFPRFGDESNTCVDGGYQTPGNIQGVFIADGAITVRSNAKGGSYPGFSPTRLYYVGSKECPANSYVPDKKFIGEGTFVGWSGINLDRTFDDGCSFTKAWHDRSPTEVFNYRPDFLNNAPTWMYRSIRLRLESV